MEGKQSIIDKIIKDAEKKAENNVLGADTYALNLKEEAEEWAKRYSEEQEKTIAKAKAEIVERRKIVANMEVKKIVLRAKQRAIDEVFALVYKKLCDLKKPDYLKFVLKLAEGCCEAGDVIVLSNDGVLSEKDFENAAFYKAKGLSVQKERGDFIGGIKLIGKFCDKDLTFKGIVESKKEEYTFEVAQKLFG